MINEHKKNRRAVKYNVKPRNFVAKNATTSGAGEHKDKSKEIPRKAKHKNREMDMSEGMDPDQRARLDDLIDQYRTASDPEAYYGLNDEYGDPDEIIGQIRQEFGDNIADQVEAGADKMHYPRQGHSQAYDRLSQKDPVDRTTKGGKMFKQDSDFRKNNIAAKFRMNGKKGPLPLPEGVAEGERTMSRAAKGYEKYGKKGMMALAKAGRDGKDLDKIRDKYDKYNESIAESILKEDIMGAPRPEDNHEASMALSELYRNAKYGMALLKIIEPNDAIDGWVQANLTSAADMLDKVGHYLDYKNINGRKPEVDMDEDDNVDDTDVGEADGSMARENLEMIVEYSIKLMEMIKPGDNLASWVSMKLTKASEAISSAKHFIEYRQFEKHASDAFESKLTRLLAQKLSERMLPTNTFVGSKKNKLGSAGQLKGSMKRPARAGDLVGGGAAESVSEDDEAMKNFLAKGGKIQHLKPQKGPKSPGLSYGSKHIGAAGGRGSSKGKVSGLGAATRKTSNKPVVTAEEVSVDAFPTDTGDWSYSIDGKPVDPGSDLHNSIKDQHMDQISPIYKPLKQMMSQPTGQSMGADPRKDSENDVQDGDVIIPSHEKGEWVKVRDIGENEKPKTVAKTWDEMSSQEKLSGVKGRTVWNPKTQKYRTVFDVPAQSKK